jgi:valyl-tRNA synthetase
MDNTKAEVQNPENRFYEPHVSEKKWQEYWEAEGVGRFEPKSDRKIFSIDTPPPTVSGTMHMGHAFAYSQMDIIARYHILKGENVFYPFGFDDNGLATERFVEKKIGKRSIDMPRSEFVATCLAETAETEKELKSAWQSLGIAADWTLSYRTIDAHCRRVSQRSFIELYNMGREYRKNSPALWCPECRTAIAQVELNDKESESLFSEILFELEDGSKIHIATTRPEFLSACVAVFVNPEDKRYSMLIGKKAKVPLFDYSVPIIGDAKADPEKGTGIVMCCTFGDQTDIEWWKKYAAAENRNQQRRHNERASRRVQGAQDKRGAKKNNRRPRKQQPSCLPNSHQAHSECARKVRNGNRVSRNRAVVCEIPRLKRAVP